MIAEARVKTGKPSLYLQQLCAHFGHRISAEHTEERGSIRFDAGTCELAAEPETLVVRVEAADQESLERLERVVGSHLERFGYRDALTVQWTAQP
jgi:hypothetical protein